MRYIGAGVLIFTQKCPLERQFCAHFGACPAGHVQSEGCEEDILLFLLCFGCR